MSEAEQKSEYARIVTNHEEVVELTDLIRMRGKGTDGQTNSLVTDTILNFGDDTVSVKAFDPMASIWVHLRGPFPKVRREGRLVIGDIQDFRDYLGRFGDKTIVEMENREGTYYISFSDKARKSGAYSATDEAHIESVEDVENLPYQFEEEDEFPYSDVVTPTQVLDTWFKCDVADIKDILDDGDTTEVRRYPIMVDEGEVQVRVGDEDGWIDTDFQAEDGEGDASSVFGYGMDNVFSNLSGEITVYMVDDGPMWVHQENENGYDLDYMIADDLG